MIRVEQMFTIKAQTKVETVPFLPVRPGTKREGGRRSKGEGKEQKAQRKSLKLSLSKVAMERRKKGCIQQHLLCCLTLSENTPGTQSALISRECVNYILADFILI